MTEVEGKPTPQHMIGPNVEKFEEWNRARGYIRNFDKVDCYPPVYEHPDTQYAWEIWVSSFDNSAAADFLSACLGDDVPELTRLSALRALIMEVRRLGLANDEDPDATSEALTEVQQLFDMLQAAIRKATEGV